MRGDGLSYAPCALLILCVACAGCRTADKGSRNVPARDLTNPTGPKRAAPPKRAASPKRALAPSPYKACVTPPKGMKCVAGGPFWRGSDKHRKNERPRARVVVSTFYLDANEVTNPIFARCVRMGLCKRPKAFMWYRGFHGRTQPAVPVSWYNALKTCLLLGKRLPTEAEWEKGARTTDGRTYPWGNDRPRCNRAQYRGCKPATTRPVGRFGPNPYGLFDLAGNGYEWVMDWASRCYKGCRRPCGAACEGRDPRGPCQGVLHCKGHRRRVLRGGSWYWPTNHMRTSWRRPEYPKSGNHRLSFRCATRSGHPKPRTRAQVRQIMRALATKPLPL